jgi:O-succinylbenzoic acid--CoA ligase
MTHRPSLASSARRAATEDPTATAVVDGDVRWSRAELDERAEAVAHGLSRIGVGRGARVALLATPSAGAIAVLHGLARVGAVVAPLGIRLTESELVAAAEVIDPRLVIHDVGRVTAASALGRPRVLLDDLLAASLAPGPEPEREWAEIVPPATDAEAPAVVVLTSGTTGRPKAAVLSAAALVASSEAWLAALPRATGWLLALGLEHVAGLGIAWRAALSAVPLVVLPRPDPAGILAALAADPAPSHVSVVPTTLVRLLDAVADGPPPASLRAVLLGGGAIPPELVRRAITAGWPVVPTYGLTEAGSGVTVLPTSEAARHPESAGRPLPGVEVRISEAGSDGVGEILVDSPARFTGYLGDPAATAAALTADGWLRTGDLGRLDRDGRLFVLDRRTDRIVRGGENISPGEVESVLLDHPAIADAAVVARRDAIFGQVPVAAIVLITGSTDPGDDALIAFCRERLAPFKVPAAYVRRWRLPRTATGKIKRAELRATLESGAAGTSHEAFVDRPGGVRIAYRRLGAGPVHLLLLHGTLSTSAQLTGLTRALADTGSFTVLAVDRRGSGRSRLVDPSPLGVDVHLDDLVAVLDAEDVPAAAFLGVSFGGVVALEFAARHPGRAVAVVAYEPPYGPLASQETQRGFAILADATERAHRSGGPAAAAETFMGGVAGPEAWARLPERTRGYLADEGQSAFVDAALGGLHPSGLRRIRVPVTILTGDASEPFYRPIAEALRERIPGSRHVPLPGLTHASPITDPAAVSAAVTAALASDGLVPVAPAHGDQGSDPARNPTEESLA